MQVVVQCNMRSLSLGKYCIVRLFVCDLAPGAQGDRSVSISSDGVQAASLLLPCRDMCEAVTSTCGCGQERSVGNLLQKAMKGLLVSVSIAWYCFQKYMC